MMVSPALHRYRIQLDHGYDTEAAETEFDAIGSEIALSRLETIPNKRRAVIFEDDRQIADLTFLEGFWRIAPQD